MKVISFLWGKRTWLATINAVLDLYLPLIYFVVVIVYLSILTSVAIFIITIVPMAWLIFVSVQGFAAVERARTRVFVGVDVPSPHTALPGNWFQRLWRRTKAPATWLELLYSLVYWLPALIGGTVVVLFWAVTISLLIAPFLPGAALHFGLFTDTGQGRLWCWPLAVVGLCVSPLVARGWAWVDGTVVRYILGANRSAELEARVDELSESRAIAVEAAEQERRRIERDLHDGAQQRLVALSMSLGMAKSKFDSDPQAARALLDEAHSEAKNAIVELRDLARGIHPVALTDRGLEGAISGLAARAPLPVTTDVRVERRPDATIEGMAYFIVSECLTNVAKHADASAATVVITETAQELVVVVTDNGRGGANAAGGTGLQGLADRVSSVDGRFDLSSPVGGPTSVTATLPLTVEPKS